MAKGISCWPDPGPRRLAKRYRADRRFNSGWALLAHRLFGHGDYCVLQAITCRTSIQVSRAASRARSAALIEKSNARCMRGCFRKSCAPQLLESATAQQTTRINHRCLHSRQPIPALRQALLYPFRGGYDQCKLVATDKTGTLPARPGSVRRTRAGSVRACADLLVLPVGRIAKGDGIAFSDLRHFLAVLCQPGIFESGVSNAGARAGITLPHPPDKPKQPLLVLPAVMFCCFFQQRSAVFPALRPFTLFLIGPSARLVYNSARLSWPILCTSRLGFSSKRAPWPIDG